MSGANNGPTQDRHGSRKKLDTFYPFLRLPGELRNKIYGFALSRGYTEGDLVCPEPAAHELLYHQLRFVNRQLYWETAGLELRVSDVQFDSVDSSPATWFLHAIEKVPYLKKHVHQLRTVNLELSCATEDEAFASWSRFKLCRSGIFYDIEGLKSLAQFCRENPQVNVRYHIPEFEIRLSYIHRVYCPQYWIFDGLKYAPPGIYQGIAYMFALRGRDLSTLLLDRVPRNARHYLIGQFTSSEITSWRTAIEAPNLRFWPVLSGQRPSESPFFASFSEDIRKTMEEPESELGQRQLQFIMELAQNGF
jgi:hypothetical protein